VWPYLSLSKNTFSQTSRKPQPPPLQMNTHTALPTFIIHFCDVGPWRPYNYSFLLSIPCLPFIHKQIKPALSSHRSPSLGPPTCTPPWVMLILVRTLPSPAHPHNNEACSSVAAAAAAAAGMTCLADLFRMRGFWWFLWTSSLAAGLYPISLRGASLSSIHHLVDNNMSKLWMSNPSLWLTF